MSQFGKFIRKTRKEKGIVLELLAKKIGTHKGYLSGIENGKVKPPSVRLIRKMARLFELDENEMIKLATLEKIPGEIREEYEKTFLTPPSRENKSTVLFPTLAIPLLNTAATRYPTQLTPEGDPDSLTNTIMTIPKLAIDVKYALIVCDDQMESRGSARSFSRGDLVLLSSTASFEDNDVAYIIRTVQGSPMAQIREILFEKNNNIGLYPWNKKYPSELISWDDIDLMLKVAAHCNLLERKRNAEGIETTNHFDG